MSTSVTAVWIHICLTHSIDHCIFIVLDEHEWLIVFDEHEWLTVFDECDIINEICLFLFKVWQRSTLLLTTMSGLNVAILMKKSEPGLKVCLLVFSLAVCVSNLTLCLLYFSLDV